MNAEVDFEVMPRVFHNTLRTGGPGNRGLVDCIYFRAGKKGEKSDLPKGRSWARLTFRQWPNDSAKQAPLPSNSSKIQKAKLTERSA